MNLPSSRQKFHRVFFFWQWLHCLQCLYSFWFYTPLKISIEFPSKQNSLTLISCVTICVGDIIILRWFYAKLKAHHNLNIHLYSQYLWHVYGEYSVCSDTCWFWQNEMMSLYTLLTERTMKALKTSNSSHISKRCSEQKSTRDKIWISNVEY